MWLTILHDWDSDKEEEMKGYIQEALWKDKTFIVTEEKEDRISIRSQTKDQAYRRGSLFHHRFGCFYEVVWGR